MYCTYIVAAELTDGVSIPARTQLRAGMPCVWAFDHADVEFGPQNSERSYRITLSNKKNIKRTSTGTGHNRCSCVGGLHSGAFDASYRIWWASLVAPKKGLKRVRLVSLRRFSPSYISSPRFPGHSDAACLLKAHQTSPLSH